MTTVEVEQTTIVDPNNENAVLSIVECLTAPGVYGIVLLNPDGSNL